MGPLDILFIVTGVIGIGGNSVVCFVIWRVRDLHTLTNAFIFNQAVADLLCSLALLLYSIIPLPNSLPSGLSGLFLCHMWISETILWFFMNTSSVSLAALTLERYLAIVFPFRYQTITSESSRRLPAVAIASTWIIGFGLECVASIFLVDYSESENRCEYTTLSPASNTTHGIIFALYIVYFTTTASTMLLAYIHIAVVLKRSAKLRIRLVPVTVSRPSETEYQPAVIPEEPLLRARRNVIKTLTLVFAVYIVCWLPNEIMSAVGTSGLPLRVSVLLVASNSCVNPLIYSIQYRSFRNGIRQLIRKTA